jgi:F-type H+-transporting ATPase subunit delta
VREPTIARNYAEALFDLGERTRETERYAGLMTAIADAMAAEPTVRVAIESPGVPKAVKLRVLERALAGHASAAFLRFLAAVVKRERQTLIPAIAADYVGLVDDKLNRVHAGVTLAREADRALQDLVRRRLSEALRKEVIPHFRTDPAILGGMILRVRDRIIDGSLRRRMVSLRRALLNH